jgi:hypothetical protein
VRTGAYASASHEKIRADRSCDATACGNPSPPHVLEQRRRLDDRIVFQRDRGERRAVAREVEQIGKPGARGAETRLLVGHFRLRSSEAG